MSNHMLGTVANAAAAVGILLCLIAGGARLLGSFHVLGYEAMTLFIGGIALMVFAGLIELRIVKSLLAGGARGGAGR
jgi:hypothetical protein